MSDTGTRTLLMITLRKSMVSGAGLNLVAPVTVSSRAALHDGLALANTACRAAARESRRPGTGRADSDLAHLAEHIELGDAETGETVHAGCIFELDQVEPAAASWSPGRGAVLLPTSRSCRTDPSPRWERAGANPRGRPGSRPIPAQLHGTDARPHARVTGDRLRCHAR